MPDRYFCEIIEHEEVADGTFAVAIGWNDTPRPGQFIHIKCGEDSLLRRPISICGVGDNTLKFVFEVKGAGTRWLSERYPGLLLDVLGPLGNGFSLPDGEEEILVVGGGIGVPPLLFAAASARGEVTALLGFRDEGKVILVDEFKEACADVRTITDDKGYVTELLAEALQNGAYGAVLACGPRAMLKAVAELCARHGVPCQVSLEERMGCGVGACLVCACATRTGGSDHMSRVCKDGPVFCAEEVVW